MFLNENELTSYIFGGFVCCFQLIQTISAVDKDEPPSGHRFYFSLALPVAGNLNFTLRDNKGTLNSDSMEKYNNITWNTMRRRIQ